MLWNQIRYRLFVIIAMIMTLGLAGCYTQFSRPGVDTDYYPDEDEEYVAEYYEYEEDYDEYEEVDNVVFHYSDVYVPPARSIYYGPDVWGYWSPYYRYHRPYYDQHHYDPWYHGHHVHVGHWRTVHDPFWDPWHDDWHYYNCHYAYHPRHVYWESDYRDHNRRAPEPRVKREFNRRETQMSQRMKKKQKPSDSAVSKRLSKGRAVDGDRAVSTPKKPTRRPTAGPRKPTKTGTPDKRIVRRTKTKSPPSSLRKPTSKPGRKSSGEAIARKSQKPKQRVTRSKPKRQSEPRSTRVRPTNRARPGALRRAVPRAMRPRARERDR